MSPIFGDMPPIFCRVPMIPQLVCYVNTRCRNKTKYKGHYNEIKSTWSKVLYICIFAFGEYKSSELVGSGYL